MSGVETGGAAFVRVGRGVCSSVDFQGRRRSLLGGSSGVLRCVSPIGMSSSSVSGGSNDAGVVVAVIRAVSLLGPAAASSTTPLGPAKLSSLAALRRTALRSA